MKKIILFAAIVSYTGTAFSQNPAKPVHGIASKIARPSGTAAHICLPDSVQYSSQANSQTFQFTTREFYTYDAHDNRIHTLAKSITSTGGPWVNSYSVTDVYNAANDMTSETQKNWNASTNAWINSYMTLSTYNSNHQQLTVTSQHWNTLNTTWRNEGLTTNTYNGSHFMLSSSYQDWDTINSAWTNQSRTTYTYDANNNPTRILDQHGVSGNGWADQTLHTATYSPTNKLLVEIDQDATNGPGLTNVTKNIYGYDAADHVAQQILQYWNTSWQNVYRLTTTYDAQGNSVLTLTDQWNSSTSAWDASRKETKGYDASGNLLTSVRYNWNASTNSWVNDYQNTNVYNQYNYNTSYMSQSWNSGTNTWENTNIYLSYYDCSRVSGIASVALNKTVELYPNPSSSFIRIASSTPFVSAVVTDLMGKTMTMDLHNGAIDISALNNGIYMIRLFDSEGAIKTGKFIKGE